MTHARRLHGRARRGRRAQPVPRDARAARAGLVGRLRGRLPGRLRGRPLRRPRRARTACASRWPAAPSRPSISAPGVVDQREVERLAAGRARGARSRRPQFPRRARSRPLVRLGRSSAVEPRIPEWKLRSAGARRAAAHTASMTSRSCPRRRTRDPDDIDITWTLGPYRLRAAAARLGHGRRRLARRPRDRSASSAASAVLNLEGIWTRYEDPDSRARAHRRASPRSARPRDAAHLRGAGQGGADRGSASARSRTRASSPRRRSRHSGCASTTRPRSTRASTSS